MGTTRSSDGLDPRRRRILFRAWRRGTRELDLLLGRFADAHIAALDDHRLAEFEALLDVPDGVVVDWITGREPVAVDHATPLMQALIAFHAERHDQA
jgi:antitoxin CptB